MKIQILLVLGIQLLVASTYAQDTKPERPDYKGIKNHIEDKNSEFYYPKIKSRLMEKDTTLSSEAYRHLYYGFVFQKEYHPYAQGTKDEELLPYYKSEKLEKDDVAKVISLSNEALKENPFDLRVLNFLAYAYHLDGNDDMAKKTVYTFRRLIDAIMSSGDGLKCETAIHVQSVAHEYILLNVFDMQSVSQALIDHCDYLTFEKGKYKIEGLYFDVSKMQESMEESFGK